MNRNREYPEWVCDALLALGTGGGWYAGATQPDRSHPALSAVVALVLILGITWLLRVVRAVSERSR